MVKTLLEIKIYIKLQQEFQQDSNKRTSEQANKTSKQANKSRIKN